VLYERWRLELDPVTATLLRSGSLTPDGTRFVGALREQGQREGCEPVAAEAVEIAREVALDHWLTWQLTHTAFATAEVTRLAAAYERGEPLRQALPEARIRDEPRKFSSVARSRLLNLRFQDPQRYQRLSAADVPELGHADALLVCGDPDAAVAAYRVALADEPDPAAWGGLALALHRVREAPSRSVFAAYLPLLSEVHACLADGGFHADPLRLAAWFE
jgi:hypothetical protein